MIPSTITDGSKSVKLEIEIISPLFKAKSESISDFERYEKLPAFSSPP